MPTKVECPFTAEELRRLYEEERLTPAQIGARTDATLRTVIHWLRDAEIPTRGKADCKKIPCPFENPRSTLDWYYWEQKKTIKEIAVKVSEIMGKPISPGPIKRWMAESGVMRRNRVQTEQLVQYLYPGIRTRRGKKGGATRARQTIDLFASGGGDVSQLCNPKSYAKSASARRQVMHITNTSGFKGVYYVRNTWRTTIYYMGKTIHIGTFPTPEEAALAYNAKARELFGKKAFQNIIRETPAPAPSEPVALPNLPDWLAETLEEQRAKHGTEFTS